MARNEEKHYGRLNRLHLMKEKEEYEKANPKRPRLDMLHTTEEIQQWLPSIKKDIDFYLKKSQVTCYSDAHVEECQSKVVKLEKEFKAFVHKMKQLSPAPLEAIPWTNRPYKRKKSYNSGENLSSEFNRIATPILKEKEKDNSSCENPQLIDVDWSKMDQPLTFSPICTDVMLPQKENPSSYLKNTIPCAGKNKLQNYDQHVSLETETVPFKSGNYSEETKKFHFKNNWSKDTETVCFKSNNFSREIIILNFKSDNSEEKKPKCGIVNYDSSDSESS